MSNKKNRAYWWNRGTRKLAHNNMPLRFLYSHRALKRGLRHVLHASAKSKFSLISHLQPLRPLSSQTHGRLWGDEGPVGNSHSVAQCHFYIPSCAWKTDRHYSQWMCSDTQSKGVVPDARPVLWSWVGSQMTDYPSWVCWCRSYLPGLIKTSVYREGTNADVVFCLNSSHST